MSELSLKPDIVPSGVRRFVRSLAPATHEAANAEFLRALFVLPSYGALYFGGTTLLGVGEAKFALSAILRVRR